MVVDKKIDSYESRNHLFNLWSSACRACKDVGRSKRTLLEGGLNIEYVDSKYEVLKNADALVLLTEWKEFRSPDFEELKNQLKKAVIFDGRN